MNSKWIIGGVAAVAVAVAGLSYHSLADDAPAEAAAEQPAADNYKIVSYGIGLNIGESLKDLPFEADFDLIRAGLDDALKGADRRFTAEQLEAAQLAVMTELQARQMAEMEEAIKQMQARAEENKLAGETFLEANAKNEGVRTLESGLQIQTLVPGTGASPKAEDVVTVHYTGTLIDGTKFDSSVDRGEPASFPLNRVIAGWTEGVQQMRVGEKARLFIPSDLAYGDEGRPPVIPPGSTLIFEIELIRIGE